MTTEELRKIVEEEATASEATRDLPLSEGAVRKGRAKSVIYSVRLSLEQVEEIERLAEQAEIPPSALVREWITNGLAAEQETQDIWKLADAVSFDLKLLKRGLIARSEQQKRALEKLGYTGKQEEELRKLFDLGK